MNHSHQQHGCVANVTASEKRNRVGFHLSRDRGEVGGDGARRKVRQEGARKPKEGGAVR